MAGKDDRFSVVVDAQVDTDSLENQLKTKFNKKRIVNTKLSIDESALNQAIKKLRNAARDAIVDSTQPVKKAFSTIESSITSYINKVKALEDTINLASKDLFLDTGYRDSIKVVQDYTEQIKAAEQEAISIHKNAEEAEARYTKKYEEELARRTEAAKKELSDEEKINSKRKEQLSLAYEGIFPRKEDGEIRSGNEHGDVVADELADFFKSRENIKESVDSLYKFIIKFQNESKVIPSSVSNTIDHLKLLVDYIFESSGVLSEASDDYKEFYNTLSEDDKLNTNFFNELLYSAENLADAFYDIKENGSEKDINYFIKSVADLESYLFPKATKKRSIASELRADMKEEKAAVDDLIKSAKAADEAVERLRRRQGRVKSDEGIKDNKNDYLSAQLDKFKKMLTAQKNITAEINGENGTVAAVKNLGSAVDAVYSKLKDLIGDAKNATEQVEEAKAKLESVNGGTAENKLENVIAEKAVTVKQLDLVLEAVQTFLANVQGLTKQIRVDGEKTTKLDRLAQEQLKYNAAIETANASKLKALADSLTSFAQNLTAVMTMINAAESALSGAEAAPVDAEKLEKLKAQASDLEVKVKPLATAVRGTIGTFEKASKAASTFQSNDAKIIVDAGNTLLAVFKEYAKIAKQVKKAVDEITPAGENSAPQTADAKVKIFTKAQSDKGAQNVGAYKTAIADLSNAIDRFNVRNEYLTAQLGKQGRGFLKAAELAERYVDALGEKVKAEKTANANGVATNANKVTNSGIQSTADAIGKLQANILGLENTADSGLEDRFLNIATQWERFVNLKEKPLSEYTAIRTEIAALSAELDKFATKNKKAAQQAEEATDEATKQREEFEQLKDTAARSDTVGILNKIGSMTNGLINIDTSKEFVAGIQNDINILKKFYALIQDFDGIDSNESFFARVNELFNGTATGTKLSTFEEGIDDVRSYEQALQLLSIAYTKNMQVIRAHSKEFSGNRSYEAQLRNIQQLIIQIQRYISVNKSVGNSRVGAEMLDLRGRLKAILNAGTKIDDIQFTKLKREFNDLRIDAHNLGLEGEGIIQRIERIFGNRLVSYLSGMGIGLVRRSLRDVYRNVVDIDYALTQVEIVTRASNYEMSKFADSASRAAKEIGASVTDIIGSVETYARLGYSLNESVDLATLTTKFSKLANTSADEATTGLTATMKAFGIQADTLEEAADKIMVVSRDFPIDAKGIADAIQNGGAALNVAGNNLSQSLALIASGNAATQDPSSVGNAWKTVSARIRSATTELESMGEEVDEIVGNTAKYRAEIMALTKTDRTPYGIDILNDAGNFRSTYEIISDIAEVFEDISDMNKAVLLEDLAGKRNVSVVASALQNPDILKNAFAEAETAVGETEKAYQKYIGTVQYSLDRLNATFQSFSQNVIDSNLVKFFVDLANAILSAADGLSNFLGSAGSLTMIGGTIMGALDARQVYNGGKIDVPAYACYDLKVA